MTDIIFYILVLVVLGGFGYLLYLKFLANSHLRPYKNPVKIMGKIVEISEMQTNNFIQNFGKSLVSVKNEKVKKFYPVVRFQLQGAKGVKFRSQIGSTDKNEYKVGQDVKVEYEKENPLKARISG